MASSPLSWEWIKVYYFNLPSLPQFTLYTQEVQNPKTLPFGTGESFYVDHPQDQSLLGRLDFHGYLHTITRGFIHAFAKELLLMEEIWQIVPGWPMYFYSFTNTVYYTPRDPGSPSENGT